MSFKMGSPWYGDYYYPPYVQMPRHEPVILMQSIVEKILSYSTLADLKSHRLVCRQWNDEGCKLLKTRLTIKFNDYNAINSYVYGMRYHPDFCENFFLGPETSLQAPVATRFFAQFGNHIRSLEIRNSNQAQMQLFALKDALYFYLPNLEKLTLNIGLSCTGGMFPSETWGGGWTSAMFHVPIPPLRSLRKVSLCIEYSPEMASKLFVNYNTNCVREPIPPLLQEILQAAVNVEEISSAKVKSCASPQAVKQYEMGDLNVDYCDYILDQRPISDFNIWSTLVEDQRAFYFPNLHEINLDIKMSDQCVHNLATKWFPLTLIDLNLGPCVTNRTLQYLLSSLKETLRTIKLKYDCREKRPEYQRDLPIAEYLNNVRTVELEGYQGSIRFVENLPILNKLIFRKIRLNTTILRNNEHCYSIGHSFLTTLKVFDDLSNNSDEKGQKRSIQAVYKLGQLFPFLRSLRLEKIVDDSLRWIYYQWPYLEELEIVDGLFTDSAVTGIHPNAYRVILREESYDLFNVDALRQGLFIGNLSRLTKLKIHSPHITDVSIILGCARCLKLKNLYIQSYGVTDTSLRKLLISPNLNFIEMENCYQLSEEMISFAKQKLHSKFNEYKGPLNCFQIRDFLLKSPKPQIVLKRINPEEEIRKLTIPKVEPKLNLINNCNNMNANSQPTVVKRKYKKRKGCWLRITQKRKK